MTFSKCFKSQWSMSVVKNLGVILCQQCDWYQQIKCQKVIFDGFFFSSSLLYVQTLKYVLLLFWVDLALQEISKHGVLKIEGGIYEITSVMTWAGVCFYDVHTELYHELITGTILSDQVISCSRAHDLS